MIVGEEDRVALDVDVGDRVSFDVRATAAKRVLAKAIAQSAQTTAPSKARADAIVVGE